MLEDKLSLYEWKGKWCLKWVFEQRNGGKIWGKIDCSVGIFGKLSHLWNKYIRHEKTRTTKILHINLNENKQTHTICSLTTTFLHSKWIQTSINSLKSYKMK